MATPIPDNQTEWSVYAVRAATAGDVVHLHDEGQARGLTSDSRRVTPGAVFVALRGEKFDGHDHVHDAIGRGAHTVVVERGRGSGITGVNVVEVSDTLRAWGALARAHLRAWRRGDQNRRVIAITGSVGKTSTKDWTAGLLGTLAPTIATVGNLNNLIGLPATVFTVRDEHRFAVLEAGMSIPGEIAALGSYARPDISVVTNVGLAHVAQLGSRAGIAREKGALFATTDEDGTAIANADDEAVMGELLRTRAAKTFTFGKSEHADVRLVSRAVGAGGVTLLCYHVRGIGEVRFEPLPYIPAVQAFNLAAALAVYLRAVGSLPSAASITAAWNSMPRAGRGLVHQSPAGYLVIDDTYNANPDSMRAALATLSELAAQGRAVAVLGEMRELGDASHAAHAALGEQVADAGVMRLLTLGGDAGLAAKSAAARGVVATACEDVEQAAAMLAAEVRPSDVVLVKASRGIAAERVVAHLLGRKE